MKLIDADALKKAFEAKCMSSIGRRYGLLNYKAIVEVIDSMPVIETDDHTYKLKEDYNV